LGKKAKTLRVNKKDAREFRRTGDQQASLKEPKGDSQLGWPEPKEKGRGYNCVLESIGGVGWNGETQGPQA